MKKLSWLAATLALGFDIANACDVRQHSVDLRDLRAVEELRVSNPAHYHALQKILAALVEQPEQVTEKWLLTNFDAKNLALQRGILRTSFPPKQLLQLTLGDVRYKTYLVRSDLVPGVTPAVIRP